MIGGFYHCAKCTLNRYSNFYNMPFFISLSDFIENAYFIPQMALLRIWPHKMTGISTKLHEKVHPGMKMYDIYISKLGSPV